MQNSVPNIVEVNEVLMEVNKTPWQVKSYLGKGCFGAIVAALENANRDIRSILLEVKVMQQLAEIKSTHCCAVFDRGQNGDKFNWVAMTLVGKSSMKLQMELKKIYTSHSFTSCQGTSFYASSDALQEREQGRQDDIWAWFFMTIEFTGITTREKLKDMAKDRQFYVENSDKHLTGFPK
ncbi:hypothetical protein T4E_7199 [Trichinella pseudospiralis]|uniref:Protein kinase domain-containing protein n=1 Tax=Trichinella pseudospiralis TaxID=6337 RepID=A0A0V0XEE0_TRIPS|nr:hypothetical protein T4E_7199 [Trichinella pseudospiralis]